MCKVVELALSAEGDRRREKLAANAARMREKLRGNVPISDSQTWLLPVIFGADELTLKVYDWLQRHGLDTSVMAFPATPKGQARARLFITSEHSDEQIDRAAALLCQAGDTFGFRTGG